MNTKKWSKKNCIGEQPKDLCFAVGWYDKPNFFFMVEEIKNYH
jgi:hypothetical protein